jgi:hypothetical protein
MANPISNEVKTGTVGELLVQMRLLQHDVQAAPPLKDSGNDLIALRGFVVRTIQVKTTTDGAPAWPPDARLYHLLAVVRLKARIGSCGWMGATFSWSPRTGCRVWRAPGTPFNPSGYRARMSQPSLQNSGHANSALQRIGARVAHPAAER